MGSELYDFSGCELFENVGMNDGGGSIGGGIADGGIFIMG